MRNRQHPLSAPLQHATVLSVSVCVCVGCIEYIVHNYRPPLTRCLILHRSDCNFTWDGIIALFLSAVCGLYELRGGTELGADIALLFIRAAAGNI